MCSLSYLLGSSKANQLFISFQVEHFQRQRPIEGGGKGGTTLFSRQERHKLHSIVLLIALGRLSTPFDFELISLSIQKPYFNY